MGGKQTNKKKTVQQSDQDIYALQSVRDQINTIRRNNPNISIAYTISTKTPKTTGGYG